MFAMLARSHSQHVHELQWDVNTENGRAARMRRAPYADSIAWGVRAGTMGGSVAERWCKCVTAHVLYGTGPCTADINATSTPPPLLLLLSLTLPERGTGLAISWASRGHCRCWRATGAAFHCRRRHRVAVSAAPAAEHPRPLQLPRLRCH
eukprot:TRINITY_DN42_c1_g2_i1.p1 TRINITY_DN42_c1_g2~~TRINITY_DN42_c1_g2_i1.p1  ORF type:complete len:150 (-),score=10.90 TRINITY_DN42_c1_g2_i1:341-790(-)